MLAVQHFLQNCGTVGGGTAGTPWPANGQQVAGRVHPTTEVGLPGGVDNVEGWA